jgi:ADP-heptose:LPS heptosyltransferase
MFSKRRQELIDAVAQEVMERIALRDRVNSLTDQTIARMDTQNHASLGNFTNQQVQQKSGDREKSCRKLILRTNLSPGDIIMLTAAVRDLHLTYPGEFLTDIRTSCADLWDHNPYITSLSSADPEVEIIECKYPLINQSNQLPYHFVHAYRIFLNETLDLNIQPHAFKGDIHLRDQEKEWMSQVDEATGKPGTRFWIIVSGGKTDYTNKWWDPKRFQDVVDHFKGRIQFVQVGAEGEGHVHPLLDNVINFVGKTDLRQMVRLMYHADGVICGVTMLMHLAAAVETKPGRRQNRPCVVIAGGREPVQWESYPSHQFLHTQGSLPCCENGGCWKSRIEPRSDGEEQNQSLCVRPIITESGRRLPECMDMITSEDVIRAVESYLAFERPPQDIQEIEKSKSIEILDKAAAPEALDHVNGYKKEEAVI